MTRAEKIFEYLKRIAPNCASNSKISGYTGIKPHQSVFQATRELEKAGQIKGKKIGSEWEFWYEGPIMANTVSNIPKPVSNIERDSKGFEKLASSILGKHYNVTFIEGEQLGVRKRWDMISTCENIIGDAKFYTLVNGERYPPAKMSVISEHVWLLEKTNAEIRFLVFGKDIRVPRLWLEKYGNLTCGIDFWFIDEQEKLIKLK